MLVCATRAHGRSMEGRAADTTEIEITPAMIEAGMTAYAEREEGLGLDQNDILHIYRAMEAARQGTSEKPDAN